MPNWDMALGTKQEPWFCYGLGIKPYYPVYDIYFKMEDSSCRHRPQHVKLKILLKER
jgi:hypothetical protein